MTDRRSGWPERGHGDDPETTGRMPNVEAVNVDDAFLTAVSEGSSDSIGAGAYGTDAVLAEGLVSLSDELNADMPPVPALPADFGVDHTDSDDDESGEVSDGGDDDGGNVVSLDSRRRKPGRLASAAMGGVAASVLLFGGAGLVQAAEPDSALWPVRQAMMGEQTVDVQLASALASADEAADDGDIERAEEMLAMAEGLLQQVRDEDRGRFEEQVRSSAEKIREVEVEVTTTVENTTTSTVTSTDQAPTVTHEVTVTEKSTSTATATGTTTVTVTAPPPANDGGGVVVEPVEPAPDSGGADSAGE